MFGQTEIFAFGQDGKAKRYGETGQEMLGKTRIWEVLEERYLPPYRYPYISADIPESELMDYHKPKRIHASNGYREVALQGIFDLCYSEKLSRNEKVMLLSTFDNIVVTKEFLPRVIEALRTFTDEHNENFLEQANLLEKAFKDPEVCAVAWNQSSMHSDRWDTYVAYKQGEHPNWNANETNENGVYHVREPYDLNRDTRHWLMEDFLNEEVRNDNEKMYRVEYEIFPLRAIYHKNLVVQDEEDVRKAFLKENGNPLLRLRQVKEVPSQ